MRLAHAIVSASWTMLVLVLVACAPSSPPAPSPVASVTPAPIPLAPSPSVLPSPSLTSPPATPTATRLLNPTPTLRPSLFNGVQSSSILAVLFPEHRFRPRDADFVVDDDPNWKMWINSRAEGRFTQNRLPELAVIVANEAPHLTAAQLQKTAPWGSFLAILQQTSGKIHVVQKSFLFPAALSPLASDIRIDRVVDFDSDNQDELLVDQTTTRLGISTTAAFLYQWNETGFVELWSASVGEDNTGALNQSAYHASSSDIAVTDVDGDGIGEIVVDTTYLSYARTSDGLANLDQETDRRAERRVFHWDGGAFVLDPARSTPLPPLPTPTP